MRVDEFDYNLPPELIAQTPLLNREESKLLVLNKKNGTINHKVFRDIIDYLDENDCLVLNNTKVIPSRIFGEKLDTKAKIEFLLLKEVGENLWKALVKPARRVKENTVIVFFDNDKKVILEAVCVEVLDDGERVFKMKYDGIFLEILNKIGTMPLPPYIHEKLNDQNRYQTVYAKTSGSAAAPTAGLHFTPELLDKIKAKNVQIEYVTLHVGIGTFRPVTVETIEEHHMHSEYYEIDCDTANRLNEAKKSGKRIISVGTTSTRTLESVYSKYHEFREVHENTNIFIYPSYEFKAVDALITNFHLPKSTLIMLVSALAGKENVMNAYYEAINQKYRFFSFGDAMFIC